MIKIDKNISQDLQACPKVSDTFCLVRWKHATLNLATGMSKSCCHHPFKKIDLKESFEQLHENKNEVKLRERMLAGEKVEDCSYCWWIEENGSESDRQNWAKLSWMSPFYDEVVNDLDEYAKSPSWVELNFSSVCNLKCVYCSPIFSTKWYREIKEHGPYPTSVSYNNIDYLSSVEFEDNYENTELLEKFWPWFYKNLPNIRLLKITGGEPLLNEQTFKLLETILFLKPQNLTIGINSNLSIDEKRWKRFVSLIKQIEDKKAVNRVYLHPSIDCWGKGAEYIRFGLDLKKFKKNLEYYLEETNSHVFFISTITNIALYELKSLWEYFLELKKLYYRKGREISVTTEILQSPEWLSVNILPKLFIFLINRVIFYVEKNMNSIQGEHGFNDSELEGLYKLKRSFLSKPKNINRHKKDFYAYFNEIDKRRKTCFLIAFPFYVQFYLSCKLNYYLSRLRIKSSLRKFISSFYS